MIGTHINRRTVETVRRAGIAVDRVYAIRGDLLKFIDAGPGKPVQV
ncbi:MAG: hypothetical protein M0Z66_01835 [Thermaerobacter sp.]|nr:hypothetical protein [Thermaerobacter sp.]